MPSYKAILNYEKQTFFFLTIFLGLSVKIEKQPRLCFPSLPESPREDTIALKQYFWVYLRYLLFFT